MSETRLWQFLEEHPRQNAPWCEWQDAFGGWESFRGIETKFLQLTNQRASAVNCRTDCGQGCPRKVVERLNKAAFGFRIGDDVVIDLFV